MAISGKMLDTYVHDANAIIYIYDITDVESFTSIDFWNREVSLVSKAQPSDKDAPIKILLANKWLTFLRVKVLEALKELVEVVVTLPHRELLLRALRSNGHFSRILTFLYRYMLCTVPMYGTAFL